MHEEADVVTQESWGRMGPGETMDVPPGICAEHGRIEDKVEAVSDPGRVRSPAGWCRTEEVTLSSLRNPQTELVKSVAMGDVT